MALNFDTSSMNSLDVQENADKYGISPNATSYLDEYDKAKTAAAESGGTTVKYDITAINSIYDKAKEIEESNVEAVGNIINKFNETLNAWTGETADAVRKKFRLYLEEYYNASMWIGNVADLLKKDVEAKAEATEKSAQDASTVSASS